MFTHFTKRSTSVLLASLLASFTLFGCQVEVAEEPSPDVEVGEASQELLNCKGLCAKFFMVCSQSGEDYEMCAAERGMSGNQVAYQVGPTFSEFTDVFFVRPEGGGFVMDHIEPAPCQGQIPCPPPVGATVEIVADGCVNARNQPSISAPINNCVDGGTEATLTDGPVDADARLWVELEGLGWVSASFITCTEGCE